MSRGGAIRREKTVTEGLVTFRYKRCGIRFELLVHRDPVNEAGTDLSKLGDEEITSICAAQVVFANAHRKDPAKPADLSKAFEAQSTNFPAMARIILTQGELLKGQEDREENSKQEHTAWDAFYRAVSSRSIIPPSASASGDTAQNKRGRHLDVSEISNLLKPKTFARNDTSVVDLDVVRAIAMLRKSGEFDTLVRCMMQLTLPEAAISPEKLEALQEVIDTNFKHYAAVVTKGKTQPITIVVDSSRQKDLLQALHQAGIGEKPKTLEKDMLVYFPSDANAADLTLDVPNNGADASANDSSTKEGAKAGKGGKKKPDAAPGAEARKKKACSDDDEVPTKLSSLEAELADLSLDTAQGKKGKGKNATKNSNNSKGNVSQAPASKKVAPDSDQDEEPTFQVNKKKLKKKPQQSAGGNNDSD